MKYLRGYKTGNNFLRQMIVIDLIKPSIKTQYDTLITL